MVLRTTFLFLILTGCGDSGVGDGTGDGTGQADGPAAVDARPPPGVDAGGTGVMELTIATFNLLHDFPGFQNIDARTEMVAAWIDAEKPDLVALQEASQSALMENRGAILAERTGYHWTWTKAAGFEGVFEEGPGVLTRAEIGTSEGTMLPHVVDTFGQRAATRAEVATAAGRVVMVSAHLGGDDPPATVINADQAAAAYDFLNRAGVPTLRVLAGDMNARPDEAGMRFLRGEADLGGRTADLADAWMIANPGDDGFTADTPTPTKRIDYLYVSRDAEVISCERILTAPVAGVYASDHVGVACTLRLRAD